MKVSKKEIAKFQQKEQRTRDGHVANNLEQDRALEQLKQKLSQPETMAVLKRMKDR
jgi:hypothetical protein